MKILKFNRNKLNILGIPQTYCKHVNHQNIFFCEAELKTLAKVIALLQQNFFGYFWLRIITGFILDFGV